MDLLYQIISPVWLIQNIDTEFEYTDQPVRMEVSLKKSNVENKWRTRNTKSLTPLQGHTPKKYNEKYKTAATEICRHDRRVINKMLTPEGVISRSVYRKFYGFPMIGPRTDRRLMPRGCGGRSSYAEVRRNLGTPLLCLIYRSHRDEKDKRTAEKSWIWRRY